MTRKRRMRWKGLATMAFVAAGATVTVAIAQTAGGMGGAGGPDRQAEWCTRYVSLGLAASEGIRQGRAEQVANVGMAARDTCASRAPPQSMSILTTRQASAAFSSVILTDAPFNLPNTTIPNPNAVILGLVPRICRL